MHLHSLSLCNWRNLAPIEIRPGPRVTVFFGENGAGKTNVLEACYALGTFRSFRARRNEELVQWAASEAQLDAHVGYGGLERKLSLRIRDGHKVAMLDGKSVRRASRTLAGLSVVLFAPEDLLLPKGGPALRRRFLDRAVFGHDRGYAAIAANHERVLRSRNALLRAGRATGPLIESFDEELARAAVPVVKRRRVLAEALAPRVDALFRDLHGPRPAGLAYRSAPSVAAASDDDAIFAALLDDLRAGRAADLRRGATNSGPHTDDLEFTLDGHPLAAHASQGQLRSFVLALKLAELEHLGQTLHEPPLLLLDDVASELDEQRRARLFGAVSALHGTTIITVTDRDLLPRLPDRVDFQVSAGRIAAV